MMDAHTFGPDLGGAAADRAACYMPEGESDYAGRCEGPRQRLAIARAMMAARHSERGHGAPHGHADAGFGAFGPRTFPPAFLGWLQGARRAGRGDIRSAILVLLAEQPMHGYQIIQELARRSDGAWRPSPGSVYPTLAQLQDEGLLTSREEDGRRIFDLTDAGRAESAKRADAGRAPWEAGASEEGSSAREFKKLVFGVGGAALQVAQVGSPAQIEEAKAVLQTARKNLYRILAEDEDASQGEASDEAGAGEEPDQG